MDTIYAQIICVSFGLVFMCQAMKESSHGYLEDEQYKGYNDEKYKGGRYYYGGRYEGKCGSDGLYFKDKSTFVICSNGISYNQDCAPGTHNSGSSHYTPGYYYGYSNFCDVNLVDFGYVHPIYQYLQNKGNTKVIDYHNSDNKYSQDEVYKLESEQRAASKHSGMGHHTGMVHHFSQGSPYGPVTNYNPSVHLQGKRDYKANDYRYDGKASASLHSVPGGSNKYYVAPMQHHAYASPNQQPNGQLAQI